ncbi:hypothetical protein C9J12_19385 [Photobacterium frigidiphilum]|uniref:Uncharacterized protein n=1 Tax=Photobacterium frigidiphilum TaxID=264736 RepID=A0A2T3JBJ9_9GAMM|nr:hypothetical protein [Photobacterium frigidiphilum]PSU46234.1 hypothetical protein C9J12_19385 [Photobacterium frigidiphilum]
MAEVERGVLDTIPAEHAAMIVIAALDGDALDTELLLGETLIPVENQRLTITLTTTREGNEAMQSYSQVFTVQHPLQTV